MPRNTASGDRRKPGLLETSDGVTRSLALRPQPVAKFYREYMDTLAGLGITVELWPVPVEVEAP